MDVINIEFFGSEGKAHNVRFPGEAHASNEVILGIFYEDIPSVIGAIEYGSSSDEIIDIGDFINGSVQSETICLSPEGIDSKSYIVRKTDLLNALNEWAVFKQTNQSGNVKVVTVGGHSC